MKCKICETLTTSQFSKLILNKYVATYLQCPKCDYMFLPNPHWLKEAYGEAITKLDIGILNRNIRLQNRLAPIFKKIDTVNSRYLDYAGGYGIFTRLMRDRGFNYYHYDEFCKNIFAENFALEDLPIDKKDGFDIVSAFEVFEHFNNPLEEIDKMLEFSETLLFSTEILPSNNIENWWYLTPETGQHISFYSVKTLNTISKLYKFKYQTDGKFLHIFSKKELSINYVKKSLSFRLSTFYHNLKYKSLLNKDFQQILSKSLNQ